MHFIIFVILSTLLLLTIFWTGRNAILQGKWEYIIYFLLIYFPIYTVYLSVTYASTESVFVVKSLQFFKDLIVIFAVFIFVLFQKNIFQYPFRLTLVDKLFAALILLAVFFLFAPIGEATFSGKIFYFKGMIIPAMVYFMGRNTKFNDKEVALVFKIIFGLTVIGFAVNLMEVVLDTHFQTFTGYASFNQVINNVEPSGNFGLSWTFETQAMTKRLASVFSDPLELSSSVLMGFAAGLIWYLTSKREDSIPYIFIMLFAMASLFFAASRASFASFFVMLFFIAITFRLYTLIMIGFSMVVSFVVFVVFFASEDFYFFVIDTLTFQNLSSVGHLVEWLVALEGMIENPLGVGLAMSGNAGSVTDDLRIGGENQFLIYGVQLGWIGMIIYILLLTFSIIHSIRVFRNTDNVMTARVAFTGAAAKTGLILPLFTANAEMYLYISWISWWMIGYAMNNYSKLKTDEA
ncbi:O-antigen ligase family protein [Belliella aquatica]|uniref:O-Antigen ligase n=1 Tax=Belliella aquatica TaxID=1323734 RepID=A0ABQ1LKU9_9BACT|nr:O-antigen ligase family protein [Belliella aquatica]MCH7404194.1 O-antigen ligase family protein [Belliella aquatica]GGC26062.1 hypothetical protein GCM10010993_01440 [Belliella aquatica]